MVEECINLICDGPPMAISEAHLSFYDQLEGNHSNLSSLLILPCQGLTTLFTFHSQLQLYTALVYGHVCSKAHKRLA